MFLPIYAYGHPVLREMGADIDANFPELKTLIANMWETMYKAKGVGLAAPQVGQPIRLFIVDTVQLEKEDREDSQPGIKMVFINAHKIEEQGKPWAYEEGCLSIPDVRGDVERPSVITLRYMDENFVEHTQTFDGFAARVIQHEYDHIDGILFVDHLKPLKKRMVQKRLEAIKTGKYQADYKMRYAK